MFIKVSENLGHSNIMLYMKCDFKDVSIDWSMVHIDFKMCAVRRLLKELTCYNARNLL